MSNSSEIDLLVFDIVKKIYPRKDHCISLDCKRCDIIQFLDMNGTCSYFEEECLVGRKQRNLLKRTPEEKIVGLSEKLAQSTDELSVYTIFRRRKLPSGKSNWMIEMKIYCYPLKEKLYFNHDDSKARDFFIAFGILGDFIADINQAKKKYREREDSLISLMSNLI